MSDQAEEMAGIWKDYSADFNAMSDEEIEREVNSCRDQVEEAENWLEAVASWEAAGKPRNTTGAA